MDTEKSNVELTWTSHTEWGYSGRTHSAEGGGWKFHIGNNGSEWILRGWKGFDGFRYRPARTLKLAKAEAAAIVDRSLT